LTHILKAERLGLPDNPQFVSKVRVRASFILMRSTDFTAAIEQLRPLAMSGDKGPAVIEALGLAALTLPWAPAAIPAEKRAMVDLGGRAAWSLYAQNWTDAATLFQQLGERYPREPGVHYLRGIFCIDRDVPAALAEFKEELKVTPEHVMARVQIAILHLRTGEPVAALQPAREAVKLAPGNLLCQLALGRTFLDLEQVAPAIAAFETAVKIDPVYPHTHFYLSQAYHRAGRELDSKREQLEFTRLKAAGSPTAGAGPPQDQK
jgi:tetratricopeptide (TPR) repeat protein